MQKMDTSEGSSTQKKLQDETGKVSQDTIPTEDLKLYDLNNDCLREIFKYLSIIERSIVALVCSKLNYVVNDSWEDVKTFHLNLRLLYDYEKLFQSKKNFMKFVIHVIKNCGIHLKVLNIDLDQLEYHLDTSFYIYIYQVFTECGIQCKNITHFSFDDWFPEETKKIDKILGKFFKNNVNLSKVTLKNLYVFGTCFEKLNPLHIEEFKTQNCKLNTCTHYFDFLSQLKNIKRIKIDYEHFKQEDRSKIVSSLYKSNCENISVFSFEMCNSINDYTELLSRQKNLVKLKLWHVRANETFLKSITNLPLEYLAIKFKDSNLPYDILPKFQNLRVLKCEIENFSDEFVKVLTKCLNLKELDVYSASTESLSSTGHSYFSQLSNIEILKVYLYFGMDANNLLVGVGKCNYLKKLEISMCTVTDGVGFQSIISLKNLTHLKFSASRFPEEDKDSIIIKLVTNLPKLRILRVSSCKISTELLNVLTNLKRNRKDNHFLTIYSDGNDNNTNRYDLVDVVTY